MINRYLIGVLILLINTNCAGTKSKPEEVKNYQFTILLSSPKSKVQDIEELKSEEIISQKRMSRSQNLWRIELRKSKSDMDLLLEKLNINTKVKSAKLMKNQVEQPSNSTNIN